MHFYGINVNLFRDTNLEINKQHSSTKRKYILSIFLIIRDKDKAPNKRGDFEISREFPREFKPHSAILHNSSRHYIDVIMTTMASQTTSLTIVYSTVYSDADQRKHQSSASLAFVWGIHRGPMNSPHKWPVTRKMFPFDDVFMFFCLLAL